MEEVTKNDVLTLINEFKRIIKLNKYVTIPLELKSALNEYQN